MFHVEEKVCTDICRQEGWNCVWETNESANGVLWACERDRLGVMRNTAGMIV